MLPFFIAFYGPHKQIYTPIKEELPWQEQAEAVPPEDGQEEPTERQDPAEDPGRHRGQEVSTGLPAPAAGARAGLLPAAWAGLDGVWEAPVCLRLPAGHGADIRAPVCPRLRPEEGSAAGGGAAAA
ncbi:MAG: hypothetical protein HFI88_14455 [Lachnospiraceae bacterium]|nr:hypothetical protein [Lachnospiraceae bacterium]